MYRCYQKKKSRSTASDDNENIPDGGIPQAELQTVSKGKENVILKHSMSQTLDNCDALERKEYLVGPVGLSRQLVGPCSSSLLEKTLDVFISYRRSNGAPLASLLRVNLEHRKFSVFLDVDG